MILTREAWLHHAIDGFRPWFTEQGKPLPDLLRVSVGFPLGNRKAIGQCWFENSSADQSRNIFISPVLIDVASAQMGVLETLLHECCHAALPVKTGHRKPFAKLAVAMGLEGPWRGTHASDLLVPRLVGLADDLGPFPHAALSLKLKSHRRNPYTKVACECGFIAYVTPKMLAEHSAASLLERNSMLQCPACGAEGWGTGDTSENPEPE
jgi:SprT-like family